MSISSAANISDIDILLKYLIGSCGFVSKDDAILEGLKLLAIRERNFKSDQSEIVELLEQSYAELHSGKAYIINDYRTFFSLIFTESKSNARIGTDDKTPLSITLSACSDFREALTFTEINAGKNGAVIFMEFILKCIKSLSNVNSRLLNEKHPMLPPNIMSISAKRNSIAEESEELFSLHVADYRLYYMSDLKENITIMRIVMENF